MPDTTVSSLLLSTAAPISSWIFDDSTINFCVHCSTRRSVSVSHKHAHTFLCSNDGGKFSCTSPNCAHSSTVTGAHALSTTMNRFNASETLCVYFALLNSARPTSSLFPLSSSLRLKHRCQCHTLNQALNLLGILPCLLAVSPVCKENKRFSFPPVIRLPASSAPPTTHVFSSVFPYDCLRSPPLGKICAVLADMSVNVIAPLPSVFQPHV